MLSKSGLMIMFMPFFLAACDAGLGGVGKDENIIGEKLKEVSSLNNDLGADINKVVIFDQTVSRIHQFDLNLMQVERSVPVLSPSIPHTVLYDLAGNYIIDFTVKHMTIFDRFDRPTHNPLRFVGEPKSAAFRPNLGLLVVYDSLQSVGMLKLNGDGGVEKSWKGGPDLGGNRTIAAGDIDGAGRLVLGLSDGSMVAVDLDQTMTNQAWPVAVPFATGLTDIKWIAPVRGQNDLVFVAAEDKLALVNVATQTVVSTVNIDSRDIVRYSKIIDAHILVQDGWASSLQIYYVSGGQLLNKSIINRDGHVTHSRLDLVKNNWSVVMAHSNPYKQGVPLAERNRVIKQWRFTDLDATLEEKIEDTAKLELATRSVFALKPSKLGHAINYDLLTNVKTEAKHFNLKYIH